MRFYIAFYLTRASDALLSVALALDWWGFIAARVEASSVVEKT